MTLKEYSKKIAKLAEKYPDAKVIYSRDEEGNGFDEVYYDPTLGNFDTERDPGEEFVSAREKPKAKVNAVCIN